MLIYNFKKLFNKNNSIYVRNNLYKFNFQYLNKQNPIILQKSTFSSEVKREIKNYENDDSDAIEMIKEQEFWKELYKKKKIKKNSLSSNYLKSLEDNWSAEFYHFLKRCGIEFRIIGDSSPTTYSLELLLNGKVFSLKHSSHKKAIAKNVVIHRIFDIMKHHDLLELGFDPKLLNKNNRKTDSTNTKTKNKIFREQFLKYVIEKNENEILNLFKLNKENITSIKNIEFLYDSLIYSLNVEFCEKIALHIYHTFILNPQEFISEDASKYYSKERFLYFFETMEDILRTFENIVKNGKKLRNKSVTLHNPIFINKTDEINKYELNNIGEFVQYDMFTALRRDIDMKEDKFNDFIGASDIVLIESDENFQLGQIVSIKDDYKVILETPMVFKDSGQIKLTKILNMITKEVIIKSLIKFTTLDHTARELQNLIMLQNNGLDDKINKMAMEKVCELPKDFVINDSTINKSQKNAIIRSLEQRFSLIQGPPGTGKTNTAAALVVEWIKLNNNSKTENKSTILVTADSNIAVDNIHNALIKKNIKSLRIGINSNLKNFFGLSESDPISRAYMQLKNVKNNIEVICATNIGCQASTLDKIKFDRVIIDECGQSTEITNISALVKHAKQLVVIGDHKQLPPTINSKIAESKGYGLSLYERMINNKVENILLDTQYRMHPKISEFPSKHFYEGKIFDGISAESRLLIKGFPWPNTAVPVAFVDTSSISSYEKRVGTSYVNDRETDELVKIVNYILKNSDILPSNIGIVSPYDAQIKNIKKSMSNGLKIDIKSVDGFQGMEKDLIVFSAVRSNSEGNVGFLQDKRRLNVMLTRARRGVIIVGNAATLSSNSTWASYIKWCRDHNVLVCIQNLFSLDQKNNITKIITGIPDIQEIDSNAITMNNDTEIETIMVDELIENNYDTPNDFVEEEEENDY